MAKKRKKPTRPAAQRPDVAGAPSPLEQMRQSTAVLMKEGRGEAAVALLLQAVEAVLRQNRNLELMVLKLQREQVGKKSEKVDSRQLSLMFDDFGESPTAEAIDTDREIEQREDAKLDKEIGGEEADQGAAPKRKRRRNTWSGKNVAQQEHVHELPPDKRGCETCGETKEPMGEEVTRRLVFVPGYFIEEVHRCVKYACPKCREGSIPTAPAPPQVIERSVADATLLAHVVVSKYADHNPLTRMSGIYARTGVEIAVSTLADWVADVGDLVAPVTDENEKRLLESYVVGTDATGIKVLDPSSPEHIERGSMWCYVGDQRFVVFRYSPQGKVPRARGASCGAERATCRLTLTTFTTAFSTAPPPSAPKWAAGFTPGDACSLSRTQTTAWPIRSF